MAISVFSGEVNRTWIFQDPDTSKDHIVTLYHDTISGVRCAMLDYEEIQGSMGTSMIFGSTGGSTMLFNVNGKTGFVRISRKGLIGFQYECVFNGQAVPESTAHVSDNTEERYTVSIKQTVTTKSDSLNVIAWYELETVRPSDGVKTIVHRRFKDFTNLDAEIRAALKGNHLSSSLPYLPSKAIKMITTHRSPEFIDQRRCDLEVYLRKLINMPHVPQMYQLHSFLGIVKSVREYSTVFRTLDLGISLEATTQSESPACVGNILNQNLDHISPGDVLSKINGKPVTRKTYDEVLRIIGTTPRPLILCFIKQVRKEHVLDASDNFKPSVVQEDEQKAPDEGMAVQKIDDISNLGQVKLKSTISGPEDDSPDGVGKPADQIVGL